MTCQYPDCSTKAKYGFKTENPSFCVLHKDKDMVARPLTYCIHKIQTKNCKDCGGASLCIHKKQKYFCRDCNGKAFCEHNKIRSFCVECGGSQICPHKIRKTECLVCKGSAVCNHGRIKKDCVECGGSSICIHDRRRRQCVECGGSSICIHKKRKSNCKECDGNNICIHKKHKYYCKSCDGRKLCKSPNCSIVSSKKYQNYCIKCFVSIHPDLQISRNYKIKEIDVVNRIQKEFPELPWVYDKCIEGGTSRKKPDLLFDMEYQVLIVEIDENQHKQNYYTVYNENGEMERLQEISNDLKNRPMVIIRFNPDTYVNDKGKTVSSCWKTNSDGVLVIQKSKEKEWEERIGVLLKEIRFWIHSKTEQNMEIIKLFYNQTQPTPNNEIPDVDDLLANAFGNLEIVSNN